MRRLLALVFVAALLYAVYGAAQWRAAGRAGWASLGADLQLRTLRTATEAGSVTVVALRAAPSRVHIAAGAQQSAADWRRRGDARAAVNGGFFDPQGRSLGLRVAAGRRLFRLRRADWGVFFIRAGRASITHTRDYVPRSDVTEAVQCGPRLVVNGRPTRLKPQWARRTGIGIQRDGRVIVAVADDELSFQDWARLWSARDGLNCRDALNLDGGSSTQLSLKTAARSLDIAAPRLVPDVVLIK